MKNNRVINLVLSALMLVALIFVSAHPASAQAQTPPASVDAWLAFGKEIATRGAWLGLIILLDLILGVTVAVKNKTFQWQKLADFLGDYGPKVVGWLCLEVLRMLPTDVAAVAGVVGTLGVGAYAIIVVAAVGSVLSSAQGLGIVPANAPGVSAKG
jgi:hypothetical protein